MTKALEDVLTERAEEMLISDMSGRRRPTCGTPGRSDPALMT
jgi:hypothetical protein